MYKIFFDTNFLAYGADFRNNKKQKMALAIAKYGEAAFIPVISTQVIQEYYVTLVNKLEIPALASKGIIHSLSRFEIVQITPSLIEDAIDCHVISHVSFWDALIIVAAEHANCKELWTEDLNHGQIIRGVQVINPFITHATRH
jgi:predicted nucleic acid-binding protein